MVEKTNKNRRTFAIFALLLFIIITIGIFYLFFMSKNTVNFAFSYVAGLSMIVLPCTLPLVFIIVPLSMGKGYKKGLNMALLFGLGLAITIALYGIFVSLVGNAIGLDEAAEKAGIFSSILFMIGGSFALLFGLSELNLLKFKFPSSAKTPKFIEKRKDYSKAFFLGLFLGNAGVGCPNPLFYVLLGDIAIKGNALFGGWMGFVHGVGRATPLIFLSILGIMGVNATSSILKHQKKIKNIIGWFLVILGAVIFIMGGAHGWYEETVVHKGWNVFVKSTGLPSELMGGEHEEEGGDLIPGIVAPWLLVTLIAIPIIWHLYKKRRNNNNEGSSMQNGNKRKKSLKNKV